MVTLTRGLASVALLLFARDTLLAATLPAFCDALSPREPYGYALRSQGERCEGAYVAKISGAALQLVSLYRLVPLPAASKDVAMSILVPSLPDALASARVHVRAVAKGLRTYYQMDGEVGSNGSLRWPAEEVLIPLRLYPDGFGLLAWLDDPKEGRVFVRVDLATLGGTQSQGRLVTELRAEVPLRQLVWRIRSRQGPDATDWQAIGPGRIRRGTIVQVPLADPSDVKRGDVFVLEANPMAEDGSWLTSLVLNIRKN